MEPSQVDALSHEELNFLIETLVFKRRPWPDQEKFPFMLVPPKKAWSRNIDGVMPLAPRSFTGTGLTLDKSIGTLQKFCQRLKVEYGPDGYWIAAALVNDYRIESTDRELLVAVARQLLKAALVAGLKPEA